MPRQINNIKIESGANKISIIGTLTKIAKGLSIDDLNK